MGDRGGRGGMGGKVEGVVVGRAEDGKCRR